MAPRKLRILIMLLTAVWYGVVLPGHERGSVLEPGTSGCASGACHRNADSGSRPRPTKNGPHEDRARHCAICRHITTLQTPPALTTVAAPTLHVLTLDFCPSMGRASVEHITTRYGRAPPAHV